MGKTEKLIALAVLFAAAVVLAVSFTREKEVVASDPLPGFEDLSGDLAGGEESAVPPGPSEPVPAPAETAPTLLVPGGAAAAPAALPKLSRAPASDGSAPILVAEVGLRPSFLDEYRLYTVAEGDTWSSLAQRFYQDGRYTRNLLVANDDLRELAPGDDILVPVYDLAAVEPGLQPGAGEGASGSVETAAATPPASSFVAQPPERQEAPAVRTEPKASPTRAPAAGLVYEVRPGDTLSEIAEAALGGASRWPELLELNRGVLAKPEDLRVGMKLALPAGAKAPAAGAKPAPTAKAEKTAPARAASDKAEPKKKKVL